MSTQPDRMIDEIPPSGQIRQRLAQTLREASLLRRLLRLAVQAERDKAVVTNSWNTPAKLEGDRSRAGLAEAEGLAGAS